MTNDSHKRSTSAQNAQEWLKKHKLIVTIVVVLLFLSLVVFFITRTLVPERSVANFCSYSKEHEYDLIYDTDDYAKNATIYAGLEKVSPEEIRPEVAAIQKRYHEISSDSTNTASIGFGLMKESAAVSHYTQDNCSK